MSRSGQRRLARQLYDGSRALFEQGLYREALLELQKAEKAFRELDVRGQPFSHPLSNGVSGLANTLVLAGRCHQKLGDYRAAISCYETSFINRKFENKAFQPFVVQVNQDLAFCYEQVLNTLAPELRDRVLASDPEPDVSFRFPFSLPPEAIPLARLYELAPERYGHFGAFYGRARKRDAGIRRRSKTEGDAAVRKVGMYVWTILAVVWTVYAAIVIKALLDH